MTFIQLVLLKCSDYFWCYCKTISRTNLYMQYHKDMQLYLHTSPCWWKLLPYRLSE